MNRSPSSLFNEIQNSFLKDTSLMQADVAIVFGNKNISSELAAKTAELYHSGMIRKAIVVTGGVDGANDLEAYEIYDDLLRAGVPQGFILVDDESENTQENAENARELLRHSIGLEEVDSVISLGHAYAGPRFLMTVAKRLPHVLPMHVAVYPKSLSAENCLNDAGFAQRIQQEVKKISFYLTVGYIAPMTYADVEEAIALRLQERTPILVPYSARENVYQRPPAATPSLRPVFNPAPL